jgi:hypothetical protein
MTLVADPAGEPAESSPDARGEELAAAPRHIVVLGLGAGLVGALLLEQNDEWAASRARYMSLEKLAQLGDDPLARPKRIASA